MHTMTAILPCTDLDAAEQFFARLGFVRANAWPGYRILKHPKGGDLHLTETEADWLPPRRNPFGLYLYSDDVDALAKEFAGESLGPPEHKPWGMYEFALNGPNDVLVRIGRGS
jgi:hypothetical protein